MKLCKDCKYIVYNNDDYGIPGCKKEWNEPEYNFVDGSLRKPGYYSYCSTMRKFSWLCGERARYFQPKENVVNFPGGTVIDHDPDEKPHKQGIINKVLSWVK